MNESKSCPHSGHKTSIGGQALIEGVMMRSKSVSAMAVRAADGGIHVESTPLDPKKPWYKRCPVVRGCFVFLESITSGYKYLMRSAELAGIDEEESSAFEKWLMEKLGEKFGAVLSVAVTVLAVLLAVCLFMVLPTFLVRLLRPYLGGAVLSAIEGGVKIAIFLGYVAFCASIPEIGRVFAYHGAEHKTIACYEAGEELTPENARKHSRFHPRCGTSFILIALIISILVSSQLSWESLALRVGMKFLTLPLSMGLAYECIKLAGRFDNAFTRFLSAPGLWMQRLTTAEPDDSQLEVAIAAMTACIPADPEEDRW